MSINENTKQWTACNEIRATSENVWYISVICCALCCVYYVVLLLSHYDFVVLLLCVCVK